MGHLISLESQRTLRRGGNMSRPTVFNVARYFLSCVDHGAGSLMTHLKLQKLCYYAQAWNLVFEGQPLFDEHFEAWVHGPVCPDLWHLYKQYEWNPIPLVEHPEIGMFSADQLDTLDEVWGAYGELDAKYLERLTHQEDPWIKARKGFEPGDPSKMIISIDDMKDYYSQLID